MSSLSSLNSPVYQSEARKTPKIAGAALATFLATVVTTVPSEAEQVISAESLNIDRKTIELSLADESQLRVRIPTSIGDVILDPKNMLGAIRNKSETFYLRLEQQTPLEQGQVTLGAGVGAGKNLTGDVYVKFDFKF